MMELEMVEIDWSYWKADINQSTPQRILDALNRTRTGADDVVAFLLYISTRDRIVHLNA